MRPLSLARARHPLAVLALAMTLALAACGSDDDGAATANRSGVETTITSTGPEGSAVTGASGRKDKSAAPNKAAASCETELGRFLRSLDRLRIRLATGFSYEQYAGAVRRARAAYADLDADRLPPTCLVAAGTAAENSLNRYIEAANTWGECLADAGCDGRAVEPELQRQWQVASHWLSQAHEGLERTS